ncbi:MAG: hypothetical protein QOE98_725 [Gaiellaceae bacterium]|jgi:hypothetical protein|nr:hypothetical protein [Gaiellaceae bacterium]
MLVYIEYISRRPGVGLHEFHTVAGGGQSGWAGDYGDDVALLNVGRSWRMGPEPEYLSAWYTPGAGLDRIDFWEQTFRSGQADAYEEPFRLAARIDRAGCYEPIREPVVGTHGRYYAEWFEPAAGVANDDLATWYAERAERHGDLVLNLVCLRIGHLGPDPRGLAVWGLPSWGASDTIARELDRVDDPVKLVTASFYADWGQEQL